jgi:hypothetical protein
LDYESVGIEVDVEEVRRVSICKNRLKLRRRRIEEAARPPDPSQGNCDRGLGKPSRFGLASRRQRISDKKRERTYGYCSSSTTGSVVAEISPV